MQLREHHLRAITIAPLPVHPSVLDALRWRARKPLDAPPLIGWSTPQRIQRQYAAVPTFQASGTGVSGTSAVGLSPAWPAHQTDDVALMIQASDSSSDYTLSTPAGFVAVANSPQLFTGGIPRLNIWWCRATSNAMATPTIADAAGDSQKFAVIITFRGCITTGDPWDITDGGSAASSTAVSVMGGTTGTSDCLVLSVIANTTDTITPQSSGAANADLDSVTTIFDQNVAAGNGNGITVIAGGKASPGLFGATTCTLATASDQAFMMIALKSPAAGVPPIVADLPVYPSTVPGRPNTTRSQRSFFWNSNTPNLVAPTITPMLPVYPSIVRGQPNTVRGQRALFWNSNTPATVVVPSLAARPPVYPSTVRGRPSIAYRAEFLYRNPLPVLDVTKLSARPAVYPDSVRGRPRIAHQFPSFFRRPFEVPPPPPPNNVVATLPVFPAIVRGRLRAPHRDPFLFRNTLPIPGGAPIIPPIGPAGVATFVLDLENGATVTYTWETDITKVWDGTERRAALSDAPVQTFAGAALQLDSDSRTLRTTFVVNASSGSTFLLALPFEELTISADSVGGVVPVSSTANSDWTLIGQRAVVVGLDGLVVPGTVQSVAGGSVVLDNAPGATGRAGGSIMPLVAIFLDAQQGFARHPVNAERWEIKARMSGFGFAGVDAMGVGATLATHVGTDEVGAPITRYVCDRKIVVDGTATDSMQSLSEIVDVGAPTVESTGSADVPDWGRSVFIRSDDLLEFQWIKSLLFAVRGAAVAFYLPTWRNDFLLSAPASGTSLSIYVAPTVGAGDFFSFWPRSKAHQDLQLTKTDGSVQYVHIVSAANNGDGTATLIASAPITGTVSKVSWMELAHFDTDSFPFVWRGNIFEMKTDARVVQQ